jgi:hypothetical protein
VETVHAARTALLHSMMVEVRMGTMCLGNLEMLLRARRDRPGGVEGWHEHSAEQGGAQQAGAAMH